MSSFESIAVISSSVVFGTGTSWTQAIEGSVQFLWIVSAMLCSLQCLQSCSQPQNLASAYLLQVRVTSSSMIAAEVQWAEHLDLDWTFEGDARFYILCNTFHRVLNSNHSNQTDAIHCNPTLIPHCQERAKQQWHGIISTTPSSGAKWFCVERYDFHWIKTICSRLGRITSAATALRAMRNVWHTQAIYLDVVDPWWMPVEQPRTFGCSQHFPGRNRLILEAFGSQSPSEKSATKTFVLYQVLRKPCQSCFKVFTHPDHTWAFKHCPMYVGRWKRLVQKLLVILPFEAVSPLTSPNWHQPVAQSLQLTVAVPCWLLDQHLDRTWRSYSSRQHPWFMIHLSRFIILSKSFCIVNIIQRHCWAICVDLCRPCLPLLLCRWWESLPLPILSRNLWDKGCTLEKNVGHRSQVL